MKRTLMILSMVMAASVVIAGSPSKELADVPKQLRHHNWGTRGSCTHASICTALEYHNQHALATWWRTTYSGGETIDGSIKKLTDAKVPFTYTETGDMRWLEWAVRNRMCVVLYHVPAGHCVNLVDMTDTTVTFIDNNNEWEFVSMDRKSFVQKWLNPYGDGNSGGWAIALALTPPPPWPDLTPDR